MTPLTILTTSLTSLNANKLRAGLTLLGVVIGVSAFISLMAIGRGLQQDITAEFESLGANQIFVWPSYSQDGTSSLTLEDSEALLDPVFTPAVVGVAPEINAFGRVVFGSNNVDSQITGVTPSYESVRMTPASSGSFITQAHVDNRSTVAVLGSSVARDLFGLRDPIGQEVRINDRRFAVIGVLKSLGGTAFGQFDSTVLVPITTAYYRLSANRTRDGSIAVNSVTVQAADAESMSAATSQVETILSLRHRTTRNPDFNVFSQQGLIESVEDTTNSLVIFLGAIAGISLLVGGIGIMNIMLVSVTERTREIGIRKAVGAKRRDILFQFVAEAIILSLGGGGVGLAVGLVLSRVLDGITLAGEPLTLVVTTDIYVMALSVSAGIGLIFGIYPALRASSFRPIEALRYE